MDLREAGPGDVPKQLETLYDEMAHYASSRSLDLHMSGLTRSLINFAKDSDYPCGNPSQHHDYTC